MNRKGVEFTLVQVQPGLWKWQFQIGEDVTSGKTRSNLMGIAAHRVQQRIDRELERSHGSGSHGSSIDSSLSVSVESKRGSRSLV
jgi:hypothetical protein